MKKRLVLKDKKRFSIFLTLVVLTAALIGFNGTVHSYKPAQYDVVRIKHGDTLWDIASKYKHDKDIREVVHEIKRINNLDTSNIAVGMEILVPSE